MWHMCLENLKTRMHSSRMLTVRCSSHLQGRGCLPGGWLPRGVSAQGVSAQAVSAQGVCLPGEWSGVSQHALRQTLPSLPVDRILDTHFWKYYLAATSLLTVTRKHCSGMHTACLPTILVLVVTRCQYWWRSSREQFWKGLKGWPPDGTSSWGIGEESLYSEVQCVEGTFGQGRAREREGEGAL